MINRIISFSINNKFIIGLLTLALIGTGIWSMSTVNLGSVPDITNNQVQVITQSPNLATEDIEQFVTYPVELLMAISRAFSKLIVCKVSCCGYSDETASDCAFTEKVPPNIKPIIKIVAKDRLLEEPNL